MRKINLKISNGKRAFVATVFVLAFFFFTVIAPVVMINLIPQSGLAHYFLDHANYSLVAIPILIYFIYIGVYYFKIKIDHYVIDVTSARALTGVFLKKNYIDISHTMLSDYAFYDRPFSFNKTLVIKIQTEENKIVVKRFNFSFITEREISVISSTLDRIIVKNN